MIYRDFENAYYSTYGKVEYPISEFVVRFVDIETMEHVDFYPSDRNAIALYQQQNPDSLHKTIDITDKFGRIAAYQEQQNAIFNSWYNWLRSKYDNLNDKTFNLCYNMAYERGHSSGHDEVANHMIDYVYFALAIIEANNP